jgi:hypothetical protein
MQKASFNLPNVYLGYAQQSTTTVAISTTTAAVTTTTAV